MNQREAFRETLNLAWERGMHFDETVDGSLSYRHLVDMFGRMEDTFSDSKIGRWLGWAQAAVVASGVATLEEMKQINLRWSETDPQVEVGKYAIDSYEYGVQYTNISAGEVLVTAVREDIARALVEAYPGWYTLVRRPVTWEETS